jgi:hypothetical protein
VSAAPSLEKVTLVEEEHVGARGSTEVSWRVRRNDAWVRPGTLPGARTEKLDRGSGIVWRARIEVELPLGARLVRIETSPDPRPLSTLGHLTRGSSRARKRTVRTEYRVGPGGALERQQASR